MSKKKNKKGTRSGRRLGEIPEGQAPAAPAGRKAPHASSKRSLLKIVALSIAVVGGVGGIIAFGATLLSAYPVLEEKDLVPPIPATPRFHFEEMSVYRVVDDDAAPGRLTRAYYGVVIDLMNRASTSTFVVDGIRLNPKTISIEPRGGLVTDVKIFDEAPRLHSPYNVAAGGARTRVAFMLPIQSGMLGDGGSFGSYANVDGDWTLVVDGQDLPVTARYRDRGVIRMGEWKTLAHDPLAPLEVMERETTRSNPWPGARQ